MKKFCCVAIYKDIESERYLMFRGSLQSEYSAYHEGFTTPQKTLIKIPLEHKFFKMFGLQMFEM